MYEEYKELDEKYNEARGLLQDALHLLSNIHGYEYDTYENIQKFLEEN